MLQKCHPKPSKDMDWTHKRALTEHPAYIASLERPTERGARCRRHSLRPSPVRARNLRRFTDGNLKSSCIWSGNARAAVYCLQRANANFVQGLALDSESLRRHVVQYRDRMKSYGGSNQTRIKDGGRRTSQGLRQLQRGRRGAAPAKACAHAPPRGLCDATRNFATTGVPCRNCRRRPPRTPHLCDFDPSRTWGHVLKPSKAVTTRPY